MINLITIYRHSLTSPDRMNHVSLSQHKFRCLQLTFCESQLKRNFVPLKLSILKKQCQQLEHLVQNVVQVTDRENMAIKNQLFLMRQLKGMVSLINRQWKNFLIKYAICKDMQNTPPWMPQTKCTCLLKHKTTEVGNVKREWQSFLPVKLKLLPAHSQSTTLTLLHL